jgi:mono/diheme cytochrome c family protein
VVRGSPLAHARGYVTLVASLFLPAGALAADPANPVAPAQISAADLQFFESKIRPILVDNCYKCHSRDADKVKGGLLLDSREALLAGGGSGPVLVLGKPDESLLIQAIRYTDPDLQMPPKDKKLSDRQIADLTEWVQRGAPDPRGLAAKGSSSTYGGVGRQHWSFQPVKKPAVPTVKNTAWAQSPVDNFVLAKLEASALQPNAPADKRTLLRRVTFDLTGLPPTEAEMQAFLADNSPSAYARVVDRLLASPHYGERWGRYWLDVMRYSDTKGDVARRNDPRYPHAWTYRDYVIDAFNTDKPYNQFILEQLAADRLVAEQTKKITAKNPDAIIDQSTLAAMGFLTLGNQFDGNVNDVINDRIDVTTKAFLGLTVSCARCHDHKFDPIPTKDYYSLYGVFANSTEPKTLTTAPTLQSRIPKTPALLEYLAKSAELQKQQADLEEQVLALRRARDRDPTKRRELVRTEGRLQRELGDLEMNHPGAPARANVLNDAPRSRDYPVLIRGEAQNKGDVVPRRFLEILSADPKKRPEWHEGSGRLQLAQAIADPKNPLTARVLVNRVWQQHFGEGFVATPDDLGNMSSPPTHPELLDWLASRFVESGWSIKQLHRLILLSSTYQLSGAANPDPRYAEIDPTNKLLWRANLRRLEFEAMYDAIIAISGTLDPKLGGKPITPSSDSFGKRRALYTYIDRRNPPELLTQFDFPNPDVPSGKRYTTLVPQQALFLMNSPLVIETARQLTHRPEFAKLSTDRERVTSLYLAIFQRPPTEKEVDLGLQYIRQNPAGTGLEVPETPAVKNAREQRRAQRLADQGAQNAKGRNADQRLIGSSSQYGGPEDAWTKLAHALFQTNEAMFVN